MKYVSEQTLTKVFLIFWGLNVRVQSKLSYFFFRKIAENFFLPLRKNLLTNFVISALCVPRKTIWLSSGEKLQKWVLPVEHSPKLIPLGLLRSEIFRGMNVFVEIFKFSKNREFSWRWSNNFWKKLSHPFSKYPKIFLIHFLFGNSSNSCIFSRKLSKRFV